MEKHTQVIGSYMKHLKSYKIFEYKILKKNKFCVDCGIEDPELYFINNDIWFRYVPKSKQSRVLCLSCLQKRVGRDLKKSDFLPSDIHQYQSWWSKIEN